MSAPRNEQAVWPSDAECEAVYDAVTRANLTRDVKSPERKRKVVRSALYPRPADARVPEARSSVDESVGGVSYALGWNDCRAEMLRLLATPPAAKPEQGEPTLADAAAASFIADMSSDQPKPAGEAVDAEALAQSVIEELLHIPSHEAEPVAREIARRLSGQEG